MSRGGRPNAAELLHPRSALEPQPGERIRRPRPTARGPARATHCPALAGPLCFAGEPATRCGAAAAGGGRLARVPRRRRNTLGLWSRHCSRLAPPVYSYRRTAAAVEVELRKKAETLEQLLEFWE